MEKYLAHLVDNQEDTYTKPFELLTPNLGNIDSKLDTFLTLLQLTVVVETRIVTSFYFVSNGTGHGRAHMGK